jgi:iron complex transport system substrate-binding protein
MRVASLLPAATEIVAALGAEADLVAISHRCDHPARVTNRPRITRSPVDPDGSGAEIDAAVRRLGLDGQPVIAIDADLFRRLRPDLVLTQDLCAVCAATADGLGPLAAALDPPPPLLPLRGRTLAGILADVRAIGSALGRTAEAERLVESLEADLERIRARRAPGRPARVVCIEWLEPLYFAGHWVPDLVAVAGGIDVGADSGSHSIERSWAELPALAPDVVIVMLCGFSLARASSEWSRVLAGDPALARLIDGLGCPVWALDGDAYTSRPGPRVVAGAALIRAAISGTGDPELVRLC